VNKPGEGENMVYRLYHKEGHKSYQCKAKTGDKQKQKLKQKPIRKIPNIYINKVNKKAATTYLIKKKRNRNVIAFKANKQANKGKGAKRILVPKEIISTMESTKKVWIPRGSEKSEGRRGIWKLDKIGLYIMGCIILDQVYCQVG
jgi:hypothetical protein